MLQIGGSGYWARKDVLKEILDGVSKKEDRSMH